MSAPSLNSIPGLAAALVMAALCGAGCGGDDGDGGGVDGGTNNPQNPSGLGPKPIALGSSTDLTASGSYVLLAKTGITNVTGSLITGGHVAVSPGAAASITGFTMVPAVPDAGTVSATSIAVASPGLIYASNFAVPTPTNLTTAVLAMEAAYTDAASRTNPTKLDLMDGILQAQTLAPGLYTWGTGVTVPSNLTFAGAASDVWILQIASTLDVSANMRVVLSGSAQAKNIYWQVAGQVTIHAGAHFEGIILAKTGVTLQNMASMKSRVYAQSMIALDNNQITAP
ncbi:MAG: DUF3494 domain-containing protein [Deltaproteobacteria bacterium]|nr:DUF3494 domain-containing protein [Deltaproteobacteria bacterium]